MNLVPFSKKKKPRLLYQPSNFIPPIHPQPVKYHLGRIIGGSLNDRRIISKFGENAAFIFESYNKELKSFGYFNIFRTYNHFHNILRLFGVLPSFPFITSETMRDIRRYIGVASQVTEQLKSWEIRKYQERV